MEHVTHNHLTTAEIELAAKSALDASRQRHLTSCATCGEAVEAQAFVGARLGRDATPPMPVDSAHCPSPRDLALAMSGGLSLSEQTRIMEHISTCDRCGVVVKNSADPYFEPEDPGPEPTWVIPVARRMSAAGDANRAVYRWWAAAAAIVLAVAGSAIVTYMRAHTPEKLLARAYTESRPFEFRIADAAYGPLRQQRSGGGSAFDRPEALLQAEQSIKDKKDQDSAETLLLRGRAEMLVQEYDDSVASLRRAVEAKPEDPAILADLGIAYALLGDAETRTVDYGYAIEHLRRSLQLRPDQPAAAFNLAIVYERMSLVNEAIDEWKHFLTLEKSGGWADEARARLEALEKKERARADALRYVKPDPAAFVKRARAQQPVVPELFQDAAWREWLPNSASNQDAAEALNVLADLSAARYHDPSLREASAAAAVSREGLAVLGQAVAKNGEGVYDDALKLADQAIPLLHRNPAAVMRARLERSYALQRASANVCLEAADPLYRDLTKTPYEWMRGQAAVQKAICLATAGETGAARTLSIDAGHRLQDMGLNILALRVQGMLETLDFLTGDYVAAWTNAQDGLARGWELSAPASRMQQFLHDLREAAQGMEWNQAASVLGGAATREAARLGNPLLESINRVYWASLERASGEAPAAARELKKAEDEFRRLPPSPTVKNFLQAARLDRDEFSTGDRQARIADLREVESGWPEASLQNQLRVKQALGRLLMDEKNDAGAKKEFLDAIRLHQSGMKAIPDALSRTAAADLAAPAYKGLVDIQLVHERNPALALSTWRQYREATVSKSAESGTLVYAFVPDGLAAWTVRGDSIRGKLLDVPVAELQRVGQRFTRLCAEPKSDPALLRADAARLYEWLIRPLAADLAGMPLLRIDADDWLAGIAFPALIDSQGRYLVQQFALAMVDSATQNATPDAGVIAWDDAVVISAPAPGGVSTSRFPPLPSAGAEARSVAGFFTRPVFLANAEANRAAFERSLRPHSVVHFSGHGWSNGGDGGLVLPAPDSASEPSYLTANLLSKRDWSRCPMVVLSACMTGTGEDHGPTNPRSLVRAFLAGGASRVVASRWNADSAATATLMQHFYQSLRGGDSPAFALAEADRALLRNTASSHPYYWAAFAVYGQP